MRQVFWSEGGELFAITCEGAFYVLRYNREAAEAKLGKVPEDEGIEEAFDVVSEIPETYGLMRAPAVRLRKRGLSAADWTTRSMALLPRRRVKTACWVGDCFIYTNSANRLNYYVGGQINTAAHFDKYVGEWRGSVRSTPS